MNSFIYTRKLLSSTLFVLVGLVISTIAFAQPSYDNCSTPQGLTTSTSCNPFAGTIRNATFTTGIGAYCGNALSPDVYFKFTATNAFPVITLNNMATGGIGASPRLQLFNNDCNVLTQTSLACVSGTNVTSLSLATTGVNGGAGLTVGQDYLIRVYTNGTATGGGASSWQFDICVVDPPANDDCANAQTLTSSSTCTGTAGNMQYALPTSGVPSNCGNASSPDVWYRFVAQSAFPVINLSSVGADLNSASPRIQLLSGACNSWTSLACVSGTILNTSTAVGGAGLTIGATYYIRLYTNSATVTGTAWTYNICVIDPPANDDCANAQLINSSAACVNTAGNLNFTNPTASVPGSCGNTNAMDVWYKFVAKTAYPTISLTGAGSDLSTSGTRLQLLSGGCGAWTSLSCQSGTTSATINTSTAVGGAGLTPGATYYIRVTSNTNSTTGTAWNFNLCVTDPATTNAIEYSRSYINVSDSTTGGTIDIGDTLEMRTTVIIKTGSFDSLAFYDTLYNGRGFKLLPNSIAFRTNEGKVYKTFTDASNDNDAGWFELSGSDTVIRMNLGTVASRFSRGRLNNTSFPRIFGSPCLVMCTYRVVVYAPYNTQIPYRTGRVDARDVTTGVVNTFTFNQEQLVIYQTPGLCPNATTSNGLGVEFNGTFGVPSNPPALPRNRGTSPYTFGYAYSPFVTGGGPQDYYYAIANNTSATYTTINTLPKPDATGNRVFRFWDIIGDHTGAVNTARGNPPCDTTKPVSATNPCGYMLVINSAYRTDTAFQYAASNLCPNTYYEFSAWFRNICYNCGADSLGRSVSSLGYIPLAPGDSSGVQPNLAFSVNSLDYYTTGNLRYYGTDLVAPQDTTQSGSDTLNRWVKRGFTYRTGPAENSFTLTIRNNAPGGGGNDWAIDDISLTTCLPNMRYSPSLNPTICRNNAATINDTVISYFNNYNHYKWQRSTDNGVTWTDVSGTGATGTATPAQVGNSWQYVTSYTIPPTSTNMSNTGNIYRVVVATAAGNLSDANCQMTDGMSQITLNVVDCGVPLETELLSFNGRLIDRRTHLSWSTSKEKESLHFNIEKSTDGINFFKIGTVTGYNQLNAENNNYSFVDSQYINEMTSYRIALANDVNTKLKYSRIVQLNNPSREFMATHVVNPFSDELSFDLTMDKDARIEVALLNISGNAVKKQSYAAHTGLNNFSIPNLKSLTPGIYVLQIQCKDKTIIKKVMKK